MSLSAKFALIRAARVRHLPVAGVVAGDEGELAVLSAFQSWQRSRGPQCTAYPALRVPRPDKGGKFEIDLVLLGPHGIVGLEVKHWGGQVEVRPNGRWKQTPTVGEPVEHDDPVALMADKMAALRHYLAEANSISLPPTAIHARVVFTNPRLILGEPIVKRAEVLTIANLPNVFSPLLQPNRPGLWAGFRRMFGLEPTVTPLVPSLDAVGLAMARLPTWDRIQLHGGQVLKGDVIRPELRLGGDALLRRRDTLAVQFHIPRTYFFGLFSTPSVSWTDSNGQKHRAPLQPNQHLELRPAGQRDVTAVPVAHVERVDFGWRDESYYDAPLPDLETYAGKSYRGTIRGVKDFGVFVNLDGHRDGLVHVSKLKRAGKSPTDFQVGQQLAVRVVETRVRNGKEEIGLELC